MTPLLRMRWTLEETAERRGLREPVLNTAFAKCSRDDMLCFFSTQALQSRSTTAAARCSAPLSHDGLLAWERSTGAWLSEDIEDVACTGSRWQQRRTHITINEGLMDG